MLIYIVLYCIALRVYFIDGVTAQEGSIFMMTTNHFEKLDEALIRPGRCDKQVEVRPASKNQLERMYLRFFSEEDDRSNVHKAATFANLLPSGRITMAHLQGFFMEYANQPDGADLCLRNIRDLQNNVKVDFTMSSLKASLPMYAYLERLSLERYTPLFERLGVYNSAQLQNAVSLEEISLSSLKKISYRLRYDKEAIRLLKMIFSTDEAHAATIERERSLVDIADVRVKFYKHFKTTGEILTGERPVTIQKQILARTLTLTQSHSHTRGASGDSVTDEDDSGPSSGSLCAIQGFLGAL